MATESSVSNGFWQDLRQYVSEVRTEMKRVTWPNRQEVISTTVMVILTTFLFGAYFALTDFTFSKLVLKLISWGKAF